MNNFQLPGFYWYVKGEVLLIQEDIDTLVPICERVLYSSIRRLGFDEFSREVLKLIPKAERQTERFIRKTEVPLQSSATDTDHFEADPNHR